MEVLINLAKLQNNIAVIQTICRSAGIQPVWVTKGCHSHPAVIRLLDDLGTDLIGEAYLVNLQHIRANFAGRVMMIRPPSLHWPVATPMGSDIYLVSSIEHGMVLSRAGRWAGRRLQLIVMVDVGNLREGLMPERVTGVVEQIVSLAHVELTGLGTAVGCYGGYLAGVQDMQRLVQLANSVIAATGYPLQTLSASSGSMLLELARTGTMPKGINQLRIGAAFLVGEEPTTSKWLTGLCQDGFVYRGEILELSRKPSLPAAPTGADHFGRTVVFVDQGERNKALLDFGMSDVDVYALTPQLAGINILGATSTYTVCDVTDCAEQLSIGDLLDFRMGYSAVDRALASPYVRVQIINIG